MTLTRAVRSRASLAWLPIVLMLGLFVAGCTGSSSKQAQEKPTTPPGFAIHAGKHLTLAYPQEWQPRRGEKMLDPAGDVEFVGARQVSGLQPLMRIYDKASTFGDFEREMQVMRGFAKMRSDREVVRDQKIDVPGARRAQLIEDTMPQYVVNGEPRAVQPPKGGPDYATVPIHRIMVFALTDQGRFISLMVMAPERFWDTTEPKFEKAIDSLRLHAGTKKSDDER